VSNILLCINAVLPMLLTIAAGYTARRLGWIREEDVPRMNGVAFRVFVPVMCFYNIYSSDLSSAVSPRLLAFTLAAVLATFGASLWYAERFVGVRARRGVVIQGIYRSNYLVFGVSFVSGLVPNADLGMIAVVAAIVVPLFNILAVITLEIYSGKRTDRRKMLLDILKNPLIVGIAAGVLFLALGIRLPQPVEKAVRDVAGVASPLILFLLGAFFKLSGVEKHRRELLAACLGRLAVCPAVVLGAAVALGFRGMELVTLIAVFASSTAVVSFTMAQQMGGDAELAGDIVVVTSALASFSLFAWSLLFKTLGLY